MASEGIRRSRFSDVPNGAPATTESNQATQRDPLVSQIMANAQREIQERLRQLKAQQASQAPPTMPAAAPPQPSVAAATAAAAMPLDSKARIAQLQAQIQARLANRPNIETEDSIKSEGGRAPMPAPLILNAEGRTVDTSGKEVQLVHRMPTLKANIRNQKREQFVRTTQEKKEEVKEDSSFFDQRVAAKTALRTKRALKFHDKGIFEDLAHRERTKAKLEILQKGIAQGAKKTGISSAARLAILSTIVTKQETKEDEIPDVEWWDSFVMKEETYQLSIADSKPAAEKYDGITHLIEHPLQMRPPAEPTKNLPLPVFLTKKEKKKLRRQNRREAWKEKQEKIRLGLEPPPEPKVKMSNMMRVLGSQAVQDPTKIEAHVREQIAKRQKAHEEANASRKLTVDQKKAKKLKKVKEDTSLGVQVAVYRVLNLNNPAKKFKVEMNAKQLTMTGVVVLYKNINVVVVEGGQKQQKKFKQLMLSRIKWGEDKATKDGTDAAEKIENKCFLVWEGSTKSRAFGELKFKSSPNESFGRELFKNHGVEHYWDLAFKMSFLEQDSTDM